MAANYNHDRSRLIYELVVRQEPKQARMCGVGGKADRRPIDPPPIVQLRVVDPALQSGNSAAGSSKTRRDSIADSASSSSPGPRPYADDATDTSNYAQSFLQNPYYFMFASLARPDDETELHWLKDGRTRCTTGSVVSSLYHLKDPHNNNEDAGFFVFPDLSVRTEGSYRLKLSLFEVVGNNVHHCKSIYSAPFYVYTAKKFPGMEESTPLSCSLADQGIKIRIRKDIRVRKRPIPALSQPLPITMDGEESDGDDDEEDEDLGSGRQQKRRRETKRSRLDDSADASPGMIATNQQQLPWPPAASINPSLGPTIPPPPAAPPNVLPSSSVVIPPPPKPGKETPPVNGIAMGVHVPPGSTLPGPSVFDGRGGGIISFEPPQQPAVESATQSPAAAHTTSPPTTQYRDPNLSDEPTSPQTMSTSPQMSPPAQHVQQTQQQQYAAPAATPGVAPMPPQQQYQQSAASPVALPPQPISHAPPTHHPPPSVQHQPQHPQQHMQHPQQATSYAPAPYSQWSAAPMPPAQPSVYDPYYHHPQQHHHYASYAPQQAMPPPPPPGRYDYAMYGPAQPSMGGYGYYEQHQQHHPHPQAQMMQPPPHPYTQHQMHAVPHQFAPPPVATNAPPSNAPTSAGGATHAAPEAQQTNGINGAGSPGSMPPPSYSASATPVSATGAAVAAAPNGGYDYATTPMYNNRPHSEVATARSGYAPTSTPAPGPYGIPPMHPSVAHTQPAPPPPHPHQQLYSMHAAAPAPPPPHPSHVAPMRSYAPPPHPHPPPHHPSYSYTTYSAPPPPAPEWNTQPFVNTVATHQHGWDAYNSHHAHQSQPQSHGGQTTHTQTSPVPGTVNSQGHRIQLAPLIPGASAADNGTHSAPSTHVNGTSPTIHSPTRTLHSASSSPTTLRAGGGRVSMSRDHRGGGEEGGHGYQNQGHVQGKKNPLSIGSIISEDVR